MWTLKIEACAESQEEAAWQAIGVIEMALRGIPASEFSKSSTKGSAVGNWEERPDSDATSVQRSEAMRKSLMIWKDVYDAPAETSPGATSP